MKRYAVYLFDFDYTLADSSRGIVMCYQNVLRRHGFANVSDMAVKRTIGKTLVDSFAELTGETSPDVLSAWRKEYVAEADLYMNANTRLFSEVPAVLASLKAGGARVGIVSTKFRYRIDGVLDRDLPAGTVDFIVGGEDVTEPKPSPQGVMMAIEKLGCSRDDVLYVGDSEVDALTAQRAGVDFCGVTHGVTTAVQLSVFPHVAILANLDGLCSPEQ